MKYSRKNPKVSEQRNLSNIINSLNGSRSRETDQQKLTFCEHGGIKSRCFPAKHFGLQVQYVVWERRWLELRNTVATVCYLFDMQLTTTSSDDDVFL